MVQIEPLQEQHRKGFMEIYNYYVQTSMAAWPDQPLPDSFFDRFLGFSQTHPACAMVAETGQMVGFAMLRPYHWASTLNRTAEITYFIHADYTHRGLAKAALDWLLERGTALSDQRARDARELERQREWRDSASRAITRLHAEETLGSAEAADDEDDEDLELDALEQEAQFDDEELTGDRRPTRLPAAGETSLPTLNVLGYGVSHKRLEQAVRELQLPVTLVRDAEEADVVITLRNYFKQKAPALREAEERGLPIFVLKSNTMVQMESALTSVYALEIDPRDAALREVEEAIGLVNEQAKPVELSPQNAYIRRLQHQAAERANLVSHSRGREPYRRVRLYPDTAAPRIRRRSG